MGGWGGGVGAGGCFAMGWGGVPLCPVRNRLWSMSLRGVGGLLLHGKAAGVPLPYPSQKEGKRFAPPETQPTRRQGRRTRKTLNPKPLNPKPETLNLTETLQGFRGARLRRSRKSAKRSRGLGFRV